MCPIATATGRGCVWCVWCAGYLHVDVVAGGLLGVVRRLHGDDVVDDDGVGRVQQRGQAARHLGQLHARAAEDLLQVLVAHHVLALVRVLHTPARSDSRRK